MPAMTAIRSRATRLQYRRWWLLNRPHPRRHPFDQRCASITGHRPAAIPARLPSRSSPKMAALNPPLSYGCRMKRYVTLRSTAANAGSQSFPSIGRPRANAMLRSSYIFGCLLKNLTETWLTCRCQYLCTQRDSKAVVAANSFFAESRAVVQLANCFCDYTRLRRSARFPSPCARCVVRAELLRKSRSPARNQDGSLVRYPLAVKMD